MYTPRAAKTLGCLSIAAAIIIQIMKENGTYAGGFAEGTLNSISFMTVINGLGFINLSAKPHDMVDWAYLCQIVGALIYPGIVAFNALNLSHNLQQFMPISSGAIVLSWILMAISK